MNHHLAKTYRRRRSVVVLVILVIVFFILLQKGFLARLSPLALRIAAPIWQTEHFAEDYLSYTFSSKRELFRQNTMLKEALKEREIELESTRALENENASLKALMNRIPEGRTVILAGILSKPNQTPYDTLIIDRGASDGVAIEQLVFANGDILIGEIDSTENATSKVLMYSTPGNITQVLYGNTGRFFNARGLGNGSFEVEVARDVDVVEGDMFFYPGLDNTLVGVARKVEFDARDSFKRVLMKSPVNIQEERWVEVRI